jgi:hypothetical protein
MMMTFNPAINGWAIFSEAGLTACRVMAKRLRDVCALPESECSGAPDAASSSAHWLVFDNRTTIQTKFKPRRGGIVLADGHHDVATALGKLESKLGVFVSWWFKICVHQRPSVVKFVSEDEDDEEDDSMVDRAQGQAVLKVGEIAGG